MILVIAPKNELDEEKRDELRDEGAVVIETDTPDGFRFMSDEAGDLHQAPDLGDGIAEVGSGIAWAGFWIGLGIALATGAVKLL